MWSFQVRKPLRLGWVYLPGGVGRAGVGRRGFWFVCVFWTKKTFFWGDQVSHSSRISPKKLAPPKKVEYRVGWLFLAKLKTVLPVVDTLNDLRYFWGGRWLQNDVRKLPVLVAENLPWRCIRNRIRNNDSLQLDIYLTTRGFFCYLNSEKGTCTMYSWF